MFYSGNDNYMQDLYFGNQMAGTGTYSPNTMNGFNNMQNPMYMNNGMYMNQFQNQNGFFPNSTSNQPVNINSLYPSSYRILMPVVSRVVSNSNCQYLNEDILNNMVDTVYNITEGQIDYEKESDQIRTQERNTTTNTQTNSNSVSQTNQNHTNTTSVTNTTTRINNDNNQSSRNSNSTNNSNDNIFRDLIKILIIREILSRRQFQNQNMNMYNMNNMNGMNNNANPFCNL